MADCTTALHPRTCQTGRSNWLDVLVIALNTKRSGSSSAIENVFSPVARQSLRLLEVEVGNRDCGILLVTEQRFTHITFVALTGHLGGHLGVIEDS